MRWKGIERKETDRFTHYNSERLNYSLFMHEKGRRETEMVGQGEKERNGERKTERRKESIKDRNNQHSNVLRGGKQSAKVHLSHSHSFSFFLSKGSQRERERKWKSKMMSVYYLQTE